MAGPTPDDGMSGLTLAGVDAYHDYLSQQPPPEPPQPGFLSRVASDTKKTLEKSILSVPNLLTHIEDFPAAVLTGTTPISDATEAIGKAIGFTPQAWADQIQTSPQNQQSGQDISQA